MPSITTWTRLEPRCRNADMQASLQARLHDPLWLLARQWQLGEFRGTDGGSPVIARFRAECAPITRYTAGRPGAGTTARDYIPASGPLETLVEREQVHGDDGPWLRLAAEAGLHFLRLLTRRGVDQATRAAYVTSYPLAPTAEQRPSLDP